jgi:hypothetical protein
MNSIEKGVVYSNRKNYLMQLAGFKIMRAKNIHFFGGACCPPKVLYNNIYNPDVLSKFSQSMIISNDIRTAKGTNNNCVTYANQTLNSYGKWAGCPGGSGAGYSSRMSYIPNQNSSGYGPRVGGPATIERNG